MSITSRTRSTTRWTLKMQRRIALAQAVFWPTVVGTGVVIGAVALVVWKRGRRPSATASHAETGDELSAGSTY